MGLLESQRNLQRQGGGAIRAHLPFPFLIEAPEVLRHESNIYTILYILIEPATRARDEGAPIESDQLSSKSQVANRES